MPTLGPGLEEIFYEQLEASTKTTKTNRFCHILSYRTIFTILICVQATLCHRSVRSALGPTSRRSCVAREPKSLRYVTGLHDVQNCTLWQWTWVFLPWRLCERGCDSGRALRRTYRVCFSIIFWSLSGSNCSCWKKTSNILRVSLQTTNRSSKGTPFLRGSDVLLAIRFPTASAF